MTRNVANISERTGMTDAAARDILLSANAHGRLIAPEEVAAAALWLCDPASDSINGQAIEIAGGEI